MVPRFEDGSMGFSEHCPDWNTAAEALGEAHDVQLDATVLIAEESAESANTGLDFVKD